MQELNRKIIEYSIPNIIIPKDITELQFKDDPTPYLKILKQELLKIYHIHMTYDAIQLTMRKKDVSFTWLIKDIIMGLPIQLTEGASSVLFDLHVFFQKHYDCLKSKDPNFVVTEVHGDTWDHVPMPIDSRGWYEWVKYKVPYVTWDYYLGRLLGPSDLVLDVPKLNLPKLKQQTDKIPIYPLEYEFHLLLGKFNGREILTLVLIFILMRTKLSHIMGSKKEEMQYHDIQS